MRTVIGIGICALALVWSTSSFAYWAELKECIYPSYALVMVYDADPDKPIDKDDIDDVLSKLWVPETKWLKVAIYDRGTAPGSGMRALLTTDYKFTYRLLDTYDSSKFKEEPDNQSSYFLDTYCSTKLNEESVLGYEAKLPDLYTDYDNNSVVADDIYRTNTFFLEYVSATLLSYDSSGNFYILGKGEDYDSGKIYKVQIYLDKDDLFLQELHQDPKFTKKLKQHKEIQLPNIYLRLQVRVTHVTEDLITVKGKSVKDRYSD